MLNKVFLLLSFIMTPLFAYQSDNVTTISTVINVIAVEYPPFTTNTQPKGGIAFELLNALTSKNKIQWNPFFLPPKRAYKTIESGDWCASFYPIFGQHNFIKYELGKDLITIGLVRLSKSTPFSWSSLDELKGKVVALLRTDSTSEFSKQFQNAGIKIVYVETIQTAIKMVLLERADAAMIDNFSYANLNSTNKEQLQLSKESLYETKISLYVNTNCNIASLDL